MEGLCLFLATALKFAILRDTLIRGTPNLSPRVAFAIKEFKKDKKESEFLKALVCDMFAELEKQKAADDIKREMIAVAAMMAGKVVSGAIDTTVQNELVEETLKEMGESTWLS